MWLYPLESTDENGEASRFETLLYLNKIFEADNATVYTQRHFVYDRFPQKEAYVPSVNVPSCVDMYLLTQRPAEAVVRLWENEGGVISRLYGDKRVPKP